MPFLATLSVPGRRYFMVDMERLGVPELHYVIPIELVPWDEATAHRAVLHDYVRRMEAAHNGRWGWTGWGARRTEERLVERTKRALAG